MIDIIPNIIHQAGGQAALARLIGVSVQAVHQWKKKGYIPAARFYSINQCFPNISMDMLAEAFSKNIDTIKFDNEWNELKVLIQQNKIEEAQELFKSLAEKYKKRSPELVHQLEAQRGLS